MIHDTLQKIEAKIQKSNSLPEEKKTELLSLLSTLKTEVNGLAETHAEQAESIAAFTEISTHEATRAEQNPQLLQVSLTGLSSSVEGFEQSHPRLVRIVNSICTMLSNSGV